LQNREAYLQKFQKKLKKKNSSMILSKEQKISESWIDTGW